ncbi:MAG: SLC13 family permease [Leptospirillia bacterium]
MIDRVRQVGLLLGPLAFAAVCLLPTPEGLTDPGQRTAGVAGWMAIWWISEAVPIYVTALLPIALFPLLGILKAGNLASAYGHHFIYMFMGGFMLARTIERWNLHERIALHIVRIIGVSPSRLILGMMLATAFLSMWISNTASTLIMLPIGMAILMEAALIAGTTVEEHPELSTMATCLMLAVAYAANIGGMGTLVGTAPNVVFVSQLSTLFPAAPEVTFTDWMRMAMPLVIVFIPLVWLYLTRVAFPIRMRELPGGSRVIRERLAALPPMTTPEWRVAAVFALTAFGWLFRKPIDLGFATLPGWADLAGVGGWVNDATVAIAAALLLFVIPSGAGNDKSGLDGRLLDWKTAATIPWGVLILFGGGLALAKGVDTTGLSGWIGSLFNGLAGMPLVILLVTLCLVMVFLTEVTSNTAVSTLFMPILGAAAVTLGQNPVLLMLPAVLCASCAFMLPVATPPNAIVFGSGYIRIPQMARAGLVLNLIATMLVTGLVYLSIMPGFDIQADEVPLWAQEGG